MTNLKTNDRHGKKLSQIVCEEVVLYEEEEEEEEKGEFVGLPETIETREHLLTCIFN